MNDPSMEVFSQYLRRVYTFGCWQLLTETILKNSEKTSHAKYLENIQDKWENIQGYAQERLILPKYDDKSSKHDAQRIASDLLFQEILKLNLVCRPDRFDEDLQLIPKDYKRLLYNK